MLYHVLAMDLVVSNLVDYFVFFILFVYCLNFGSKIRSPDLNFYFWVDAFSHLDPLMISDHLRPTRPIVFFSGQGPFPVRFHTELMRFAARRRSLVVDHDRSRSSDPRPPPAAVRSIGRSRSIAVVVRCLRCRAPWPSGDGVVAAAAAKENLGFSELFFA